MRFMDFIAICLLAVYLAGCSSRGNFPTAIRSVPPVLPVYSNSGDKNVEIQRIDNQYDMQIITFQTSDAPEVVMAFYKEKLSQTGWINITQHEQQYMAGVNRQACPLYIFNLTAEPTNSNRTSVRIRLVPSPCAAM